MSDSTAPLPASQRLSRTDWLDHGLRCLAEDGFTALKADRLARSLSVSRGSFYWHFKDIADFRAAVLERWRVVAAEGVIAEVEREVVAAERFLALILRAFSADSALERAMRAWATSDPKVAAAVARVDERRVNYLIVLLQAAGVGSAAAGSRARFAYWAYLGRGLSVAPGAQGVSPEELKALSGLLTAP